MAVPENPVAARLQRAILEGDRHVNMMQARKDALVAQLDAIQLDIQAVDNMLSVMIESYGQFVEQLPDDREAVLAMLEDQVEIQA